MTKGLTFAFFGLWCSLRKEAFHWMRSGRRCLKSFMNRKISSLWVLGHFNNLETLLNIYIYIYIYKKNNVCFHRIFSAICKLSLYQIWLRLSYKVAHVKLYCNYLVQIYTDPSGCWKVIGKEKKTWNLRKATTTWSCCKFSSFISFLCLLGNPMELMGKDQMTCE